jgi:hypothetical protein
MIAWRVYVEKIGKMGSMMRVGSEREFNETVTKIKNIHFLS